MGFLVVCSEWLRRRFAAGTRDVPGILVIRDALEQAFVKKPISLSDSYLRASTVLLSLRIACCNYESSKLSISVCQGNLWGQQFALLIQRDKARRLVWRLVHKHRSNVL